MAHNLNQENGRTSFFSVKEKPWHGLGQIVETAQTSEQAIVLGGLDFTVEKTKVFAEIPQTIGTKMSQVSDKYATYRTDNGSVFGIVGNHYTPVQNRDAFNFFDSIVGANEAIFETAGCLFDGRTIFITAKLPGHIKVANNDLIEQYLFLTSSHDGTGAVQAAFTPIRIVCNNTLNAALSQCSNKVSIRHTRSASDTLKEAHKIMGISNQLKNELQEVFQRMAKVQITDPELLDFIKRAMSPNREVMSKLDAQEELSSRFKNTVDDVYAYAMSSETQQMNSTKGTVFGAYNAITGYFQNVKTYKTNEDKLNSIIFGTGERRQQRAFDLALNLC